MSSAKTASVFDPDFLRRSEDLQTIFIHMLKSGLHKQARDAVGRATAAMVNKTVTPHVGAVPTCPETDESDKQTLKRLQKIGYAYINNTLSDQDITDIRAYFADKLLDFDEPDNKGEALLAQLPAGVGLAHYKYADTRKCPAIYRLAHDPWLIRLMTKYLGAPPTIGIIGSWWSFPQKGLMAGNQLFHHDRGDFRSCNLFIYLTDVTEDTGAHVFVERTHDMDALLPLASQRFGDNPQVFNAFWQWMEKHRKPDEEVAKFFPSAEIKVHTGMRGTNFLEDTRGLHKGTLPRTGPRLALEIFFSVLPKYNEKIVPVRRDELAFLKDAGAEGANLDPLVRYANRLMYG